MLPAYLQYSTITAPLGEKRSIQAHVLTYDSAKGPESTLLLSKCSEAVNPFGADNHIGHGVAMDEFMKAQPGVRLLVNGGFSHYRKNFYNWKHQQFNVGDPVGIVKIREHLFEDYLDIEHYGFFVQQQKKKPWSIVTKDKVTTSAKYILGCTPLMIFEGKALSLPVSEMVPVSPGMINPPSVLGHGAQLHPRTAVGVDGSKVVFVIVDKNIDQEGCTLAELQKIGMHLNLPYFLNLDGGGSSQFRLVDNEGKCIKNTVEEEDANRILGHVLVIFDENLKN